MEYYLLDVKSTVNINGTDVAFDYLNTYFDEKEAVKEARVLSWDNDVLEVSVHKWKLNADGTHEHIDGVFYHMNKEHREFKKEA